MSLPLGLTIQLPSVHSSSNTVDADIHQLVSTPLHLRPSSSFPVSIYLQISHGPFVFIIPYSCNRRAYEDEYHFSCQITADLIAACHADFVVTSTQQEICGKEASLVRAPSSARISPLVKGELVGEIEERTLHLGQVRD